MGETPAPKETPTFSPITPKAWGAPRPIPAPVSAPSPSGKVRESPESRGGGVSLKWPAGLPVSWLDDYPERLTLKHVH